jgi:hypothetical protein
LGRRKVPRIRRVVAAEQTRPLATVPLSTAKYLAPTSSPSPPKNAAEAGQG